MPPERRAVARRDAGLRRVTRLTRWLLAGSLALTGGFAALAARAFPGQGSDQTAGTTATSAADQSGQDASDQLSSPPSTPSPSSGSAGVTSGGS